MNTEKNAFSHWQRQVHDENITLRTETKPQNRIMMDRICEVSVVNIISVLFIFGD